MHSAFDEGVRGGGGFPSSQRGGGGFVNSSSSSSHDFSSSQSFSSSQPPPQQQQRKQDPRWIQPVTVKQLIDSSVVGGKVQVDGRDVGQVKVLGVVQQVEGKPHFFTFIVNDGSGSISARIYAEDDFSVGEPISDPHTNGAGNPTQPPRKGGQMSRSTLELIQVNEYVKVIGNVRIVNENQTYVSAYHISKITDHNEVTFHLLDCIATHCRLKLTPNNDNGQDRQPSSSASSSATASSSSSSSSSSADTSSTTSTNNFTPIHRAIIEAFSGSNDQGYNLHDVSAKLPAVAFADLRKMVDVLCEDGHLYSTIDDEHFKSTSS